MLTCQNYFLMWCNPDLNWVLKCLCESMTPLYTCHNTPPHFLRNCRKCRPENSKTFTCTHLDLEQFWTEDIISDTQEQINRLYQEQQQIQESATIFRWSTDDIATLSACKSTWETCLNCELPCLISDNRTCVFVSASVFESYVALYSAVVHRRVEAESQIVNTEEERQ